MSYPFQFWKTLFIFLIAGCLLAVAGGWAAAQKYPSGASPAVPSGTDRIPLVQARDNLAPRRVWQHFYDLTQVPRPSHHEERATAFVAGFGRNLGLETIVDAAGNVIIRKPATAGLENRPGVILQAHLDMVPQKTADKGHDFLTDPIEAFVADGWVHADGTTLGADDGIGVALIMALLEDSDLVHPMLEAVFTTNEEDGFSGINALADNVLQGQYFINVDNEVEGQFLISSAGGVILDVAATYVEEPPPADMAGAQLTIDGLRGGHSGLDIDKGRGSAHQLVARLLWNAPAELGLRLAALQGGDTSNAIPRRAQALVALPREQLPALQDWVQGVASTVQHELAATEPGLTLTVTPVSTPLRVMPVSDQRRLMAAVYAAPQGLLRMSDAVPDLVETSGNLGVLQLHDGRLEAVIYVRSALNSTRDDAAARFAAVFELAGARVTLGEAFPSWPPRPDSPLLALMQATYSEVFGTQPRIDAIHAGLETSGMGLKYPHLDMISIGPTIVDVHSPEERLEISGVARVYQLLVETLRRIPAAEANQSGWIGGHDAMAADLPARAARLVALNMSPSRLREGLAEWETAVLAKLIEAATWIDGAYWQQVDPEGRQLLQQVSRQNDSDARAMATMLDANYGRWDRFRDFEPFVGNQPRPPGGHVYPPDLTRAELDAFISANPDQRAALLSPYTVVRRDGERLVAVPYHEAYADYILPVARLLDEAAKLSQNHSLTRYLKLQAEALRTDDYFAADMAWLDLDAAIDLSIGPHETYDDQLAGVKAFYKANVQIVDRLRGAALEKYKTAAPQLQRRLPVAPEFRPDQTGTMMPLLLVDDVRRSGQARALMTSVAYSLPNDPRVWKAKGSKKVMMGNYLNARRQTILEPLAQAVLAPAVAEKMNAEAYFTWVLMHEITHTLGPRASLVNGQEQTIREALGQYYSPIEEGKADIGGLYNLPYLMEQGVVAGSLEAHYVGYLAEALRSIRFGLASAYGMIRLSCWNILEDQGALRFHPEQKRFELDVAAMTSAVGTILQTLLNIEGHGDVQAAAAFVEAHARLRPNLAGLLDAAASSVPVEFVAVY